jgi:uncharacterized protein (TIGR02452 family)
MNKNELISVFEDTVTLVETGQIKTNSVTTKHNTSERDIVVNQYVDTNIHTLNSDTVNAAFNYSMLGKTCVLNMASAKKAGGGVRNGAKAQEECLFRCSNLFETVTQDFYPLDYNEMLYTKDAVFFKNNEYELITPFTVDVVTVAAVNLNPNARYDDNKQYEVDNYEKVMKDKIRTMLYLANANGCENVVLGAWGCGVFKNDPQLVANMFNEIVREHKGCFKNVLFAVINDHNSAGDNYDVFRQTFNY